MTIDIAPLKEKLSAEKQRLENELSRFAKSTGTPHEYETQYEDIGDGTDENATEVENYVDNLALENQLESQLHEVDTALEKIGRGTYGICEVCHEEIPINRLQAYPAAKTCVLHAK